MSLRFLRGSQEKKQQVDIVNKEYEVESDSSSEKLEHVFQDPLVAEHYAKIYSDCEYECSDHFDPDYPRLLVASLHYEMRLL